MDYRDVTLHEIGPNGQGIGALIALGILDNFDIDPADADGAAHATSADRGDQARGRRHERICRRPDTMRNVTAGHLLDPAYLQRAREASIDLELAQVPRTPASPLNGSGTVYLTAADKSGMMVSFIQSNYQGFGSGVVVPNTGIALQNRGFGFAWSRAIRTASGPASGRSTPSFRASDPQRRAADELRRDGGHHAGAGSHADRLAPRRSRTEPAGGLVTVPASVSCKAWT